MTAAGAPQLELLVIVGDNTTRRLVPRAGSFVLGRAGDCDIAIPDASVSRRHAVLHVGDDLAIEELGSINGTLVRGELVPPDERIAIELGEPVVLGDVTVRLERAEGSHRPRRIWIHDYFEARLEEECLRTDRIGGTFTVVRIRCESPGLHLPVRDVLISALRIYDVIGQYAPGEFEVLLVDTPEERAGVTCARIRRGLDERELRATIGTATCPADGRSPDALQERVGQRAHAGDASPPPASAPRDVSPMTELHALVDRIAPTPINVLILGETGVGKDVLAERLHEASERAGRPFVRINCAALSESLLESELFGHERGAFTGAVQTKPGLLETADGGTVFLDEIGEMPLPLQSKLLRVIEDRKVLRVGGLEPRAINVRFVSATNRNLDFEVERKGFRQDLFFRLNGTTVRIPPLRERVNEIEALAYEFVRRFSEQIGRGNTVEIAEDAMTLLKWYSWPGNIRELRNVIERAVILCHDDLITAEHLPVAKIRAMSAPTTHGTATPASAATPSTTTPDKGHRRRAPRLAAPAAPKAPAPPPSVEAEHERLARESAELERRSIEEALAACGGNQTHAARRLGIARGTLIKRLEKYGFTRPRRPRS